MHQIQFWPERRPRPCCGSLQRSPRPLAGFKVSTSKGRVGERGSGGMGGVPSTFFCGSTPTKGRTRKTDMTAQLYSFQCATALYKVRAQIYHHRKLLASRAPI